MEGVPQCHVELIFVGCAKHDAKVVAVGPVSFGSDLFLDSLIEDGAGKRI